MTASESPVVEEGEECKDTVARACGVQGCASPPNANCKQAQGIMCAKHCRASNGCVVHKLNPTSRKKDRRFSERGIESRKKG